MFTIPLTKGQYATVSAEDYERLAAYKWHAWWNKYTKSFYARRCLPRSNGKQKLCWMHREVLGAPVGLLVDHIDRNTLDNRRENLRLATRAQNQQNRKINANSTSGYKCVWKTGSKFRAAFQYNKILVRLGTFNTAEEAFSAYREAVTQAHGEFARVL